MLKIILLGAPGSGKGTQANLLSKQFSLKHISTGELLRKAILAGTDLGLQSKSYINTGKLVSDQIIITLVKESIKIEHSESCQGFILDGFPRNVAQAQALEENIAIDLVLYLKVPDHIIINRLAGRRYHPNSGRIYHIEYYPPKNIDLDDITGEPLIVRSDDQPEVIQQRLDIYHQATEPLIDWYKNRSLEKFIEINAECNKLELLNKILHLIHIHVNITSINKI